VTLDRINDSAFAEASSELKKAQAPGKEDLEAETRSEESARNEIDTIRAQAESEEPVEEPVE
jgi:hypothetical protein